MIAIFIKQMLPEAQHRSVNTFLLVFLSNWTRSIRIIVNLPEVLQLKVHLALVVQEGLEDLENQFHLEVHPVPKTEKIIINSMLKM